MDQDDDVERLFSWLKTPELRYREFAGEREVADAVANWPVLRRTASEFGRGEGAEGTGRSGPEPAGEPASDAPSAAQAADEEPRSEAVTAPPAMPEPRTVSTGGREASFGETYRGFDENPQAAPKAPPPAPDEGGARSLDAVFSRLSRPAARYREERRNPPAGPGLGPVFRRLR